MKIKFKKLHNNAVIPKYGKPGDAGADLTAISYEYVSKENVEWHNYDFGLAVEIPPGFVGLIFPRSSNRNVDLTLSNCVGVLDSGYRGNLSASFKEVKWKSSHIKTTPKIFNKGDRVAQLVIVPYITAQFEEVEKLSTSERGTGAYGSTGK